MVYYVIEKLIPTLENLEESQSLDVFKSFKAKVELQLGKKIKAIKYDHGGEYYGRYDGPGEQCSRPFRVELFCNTPCQENLALTFGKEENIRNVDFEEESFNNNGQVLVPIIVQEKTPIDAMKDEMKSMQDNNIWDLVELPKSVKPIGSKWIFKIIKDSKGNIERYKSHLVTKGFTHKEGIDYKETFSPVPSNGSFRTIMTLVAHFDLKLHQMDVKTIFLNGDIDEAICMVQHENFMLDDSKPIKLRDHFQGILRLLQENYISKVLDRFGMKDSKPGDTPIAKGDKFSLK
ncbi:hypothetical protein CR513_37655, partial [Mucuna pruriens]